MQYENENMDELFRRAAEDYPLDTSSKDWNKVQQALESNTGETQSVQKNNKGRFLWLLLLLPMGLLCNKYLMNGDEGNSRIAGKQQHQPSASNKTDAVLKNGNSTNPSSTTNANLPAQSSDELTLPNDVSNQKLNTETNIALNGLVRKQGPAKPASAGYRKNEAGVKKNQFSNNDNIGIDKDVYALSSSAAVSEKNSYIQGRSPQNLFKLQPSSVFPANELQSREGALPKSKSSDKRFYVGLIGGMDMTTIKFQKLEDVGYDVGVLLGYEFNKKLSIESGFFFDKKIYYTKGEHFSTSKIYLPPATWINEVSGYCKMFEVPLSLKYTISSSANKSWFVAAGGSSYLMREENYTYLLENSATSWPRDKKYQNADNYFFSVIQMSGGFTHKIGKVGDLRIEPYIKLPLTGMGIGELPFLSTGLHVGITRKLF